MECAKSYPFCLANIVKSQRGIPSIVDFGFAIPVGQVAEGYTINYMSPEVIMV